MSILFVQPEADGFSFGAGAVPHALHAPFHEHAPPHDDHAHRGVVGPRVVKAGRTLTVCVGDAVSLDAAGETLVATMTATMIERRNVIPDWRSML